MRPRVVLLCIPFYFIFLIWLFLGKRVSDPQIPSFIDALLLGILVIITSFYAFEVSESNKKLEKQNSRFYIFDLLWVIVNPWERHVIKNALILDDLDFRFSIICDTINIHGIRTGFSIMEMSYVPDLEKMFPKEVDEIYSYFSDLKSFKNEITSLIKEFWTNGFEKEFQREFIKVSKEDEYDRNRTLRWILRRILFPKDKFESFRCVDEIDMIYKELVRNKDINLSEAAEGKIENIRNGFEILTHESLKIYEKLGDIEHQLGKDYGISLREFSIRKKSWEKKLKDYENSFLKDI